MNLPEEIPLKQVLELQKQGMENTEIIQRLQSEGYAFQQISEALNQAVTKTAVEKSSEDMQPSVLYSEEKSIEEPPAPGPSKPALSQPYQPQPWPQQPVSYPQTQTFGTTAEDVEELAESIIEEKWQKTMEDFGDISAWKERTTIDMESIKQELMRLENRFENLQKSIIGKVKEYDETVSGVGVEIKALEKVMQNIIGPLTNNIKELNLITKKLKK